MESVGLLSAGLLHAAFYILFLLFVYVRIYHVYVASLLYFAITASPSRRNLLN